MCYPVSIGVDPGWVNLGMAAVIPTDQPFKVQILVTKTLNPSLDPEGLVDEIPLQVLQALPAPASDYRTSNLVVERYVSYGNVRSSETENITMVIGMLRMKFHLLSKECNGIITTSLLRAIEWKVKLAQILSKHCAFQNPSSDLDKKFSIAAAKFISINPDVIKTDHEADAICLAALPFILEQASRQTKKTAT